MRLGIVFAVILLTEQGAAAVWEGNSEGSYMSAELDSEGSDADESVSFTEPPIAQGEYGTGVWERAEKLPRETVHPPLIMPNDMPSPKISWWRKVLCCYKGGSDGS